ncbi:hypothetical protein GF354_00510 [Candidatus Peregrinibacteria bacterium]|nr:hypothetical protein [Candidatus Peregrinibacteria bacterium]
MAGDKEKLATRGPEPLKAKPKNLATKGAQSEVARELLAKNKEMVNKYHGVQAKIMEKIYTRISDSFSDKLKSFEESDYRKLKMGALMVKKEFLGRAYEIGREWKNERAKLLAKENPDETAILELNQIYIAKINEVQKTAEYFVKELSSAGWVSEKVLAQLQKRGPEIIAILKQDQELIDTLQWTLGWVEEGSLSGNEEKYFGVLKERLASPSPKKEFAWVIMRYLSEDQLVRLCKEYMDENEGKIDKKKFLEEGNKYGILGARVIRVLSANTGVEVSSKEMEKYAIHYELMNNFNKTIESYKPTLGATNPAGDKINLKNAALLTISGLGFGTAIANTIVGISYGQWKDPIQLVKNEYTIAGTLVGVGAAKLLYNENLLDELTPGSEEEMSFKNQTRKSFLGLMNKPVWSGERGMFSSDKNIEAFAAFVFEQQNKYKIEKDEKLSTALFNKQEFERFLASKPEYRGVMNSYGRVKGRIRNSEILSFANVFRTLRIVGSDPEVVQRFDNEFEQAKKL